jgi:hypothetical protein
MTKAQRDRAYYVSLTLCGPRRRGRRGFISGGGKCYASGPKARKVYEDLFKKIHGIAPLSL